MINNSGKRVQSAYELERKYNFRGLKKNTQYALNELHEVNNSTKNIMETLIINLADVLDSQSDISLWFYQGIPTANNKPYTDWQTPSEHIGDLYYDISTGYVYKFTDSNWVQQNDEKLRRALALTNACVDTEEDHERKVYFESPTIPYSSGDWWIQEDGTLLICQVGRTSGTFKKDDWINSNEYANAIAVAITNELGGETTTILSGTVIEKTSKWVKFTDLSTGGSTTINGSNITTGNIQSQNYIQNTSGTKISLTDGTIDTKNFKVDSTGKITATSGTFTGKVTATSGTIGNCTIDSNGNLQVPSARITGTLSADKISGGTISGNNVTITNLKVANINGGTNSNNITFNGAITCSNINAKGGFVGGISITENGIVYSGNSANEGFGLWKNGIHAADNSYIIFHAGGNNTNIGGAALRIYQDGSLVATKGRFSGSLNVGNNTYYLRMGGGGTSHPEVSGLNVTNDGINMYNHGISNVSGISFKGQGTISCETYPLNILGSTKTTGIYLGAGGFVMSATGSTSENADIECMAANGNHKWRMWFENGILVNAYYSEL